MGHGGKLKTMRWARLR